MDMRLSTDSSESFQILQGRILEAYLGLSGEFDFFSIDAREPVESQQAVIRDLIRSNLNLKDYRS
jgi:thymidylate kinase